MAAEPADFGSREMRTLEGSEDVTVMFRAADPVKYRSPCPCIWFPSGYAEMKLLNGIVGRDTLRTFDNCEVGANPSWSIEMVTLPIPAALTAAVAANFPGSIPMG